MAFANLSFDTVGASAGLAASWTLATQVEEEVAAFDTTDPLDPWEDFEEDWSNNDYKFAFVIEDLTAADFTTATIPVKFESFESAWDSTYQFSFLGVAAASFDATIPEDVEDFEENWDVTYKFSFVGVGTDLTAAVFDTSPENFEDFEESWDTSYKTTFVGVGTDLTAAAFVGVTLDSYSETNLDSQHSLYNAADTAIAQSFASGAGGVLAQVRVMLKRTGQPPGTLVAKVYAHSGTFGSTSVPTGVPLAVSNEIQASTLNTTFLSQTAFVFENPATLTASTNYCIAIEFLGTGDINNTVDVGHDSSSPTHAGNEATYTGGVWTAVAGADVCFYVETTGSVEDFEEWPV